MTTTKSKPDRRAGAALAAERVAAQQVGPAD